MTYIYVVTGSMEDNFVHVIKAFFSVEKAEAYINELTLEGLYTKLNWQRTEIEGINL